MTAANRCFVDTNVLLAATDSDRESHETALSFLDDGIAGRRTLFTSGQVLREYLVVATRPLEQNGLGMQPVDAIHNLANFRQCLAILSEDAVSATILHELILRYDLKGKRIHDANLVATMVRHGLDRIKTFNPDDFRGFREVMIEA